MDVNAKISQNVNNVLKSIIIIEFMSGKMSYSKYQCCVYAKKFVIGSLKHKHKNIRAKKDELIINED